MATHKVSNSSQLAKAFGNARSGDVIELAGGSYGKLSLNGATKANAHLNFSKEVTVTSASSKSPAVFTGMLLNDVENLTFSGIKFDYTSAGKDAAEMFTVQYSDGITFRNAIFDGAVSGGHGTGTGLKVKESDDVTVVNSRFTDLYTGVIFSGGKNVDVLNNSFKAIAYDGLTFAGTDNLRVSGNDVEMKTDPAAQHKDLIQIINGGSNPATNVVIRDNVLKASDAHTHGIYVGNASAQKTGSTKYFYKDIEITDNVIYSGHKLGIALGETIGGKISGNTVLQHSSMNGSSKAVNIPVILVDKDARDIEVTGNTTHQNPQAANYWGTQKTPGAWTISGNKLAQLGAKAADKKAVARLDQTVAEEPDAPAAPAASGSSSKSSGSGGADAFRFDGAKLSGRQTKLLSGVDFAEDEIVFIRYDDATFKAFSGGNKLQNSKDGTFVRLESLLDVQELVAASKAVSAVADRKADTLTLSVAQKDGVQTVVLDGHGKAYLDSYDAGLF